MAEMPDTITIGVEMAPELSLLIGAAYLAGCEDQASGAVRLSLDGRLARAVEVAERCAFDAQRMEAGRADPS